MVFLGLLMIVHHHWVEGCRWSHDTLCKAVCEDEDARDRWDHAAIMKHRWAAIGWGDRWHHSVQLAQNFSFWKFRTPSHATAKPVSLQNKSCLKCFIFSYLENSDHPQSFVSNMDDHSQHVNIHPLCPHHLSFSLLNVFDSFEMSCALQHPDTTAARRPEERNPLLLWRVCDVLGHCRWCMTGCHNHAVIKAT